MFRFEDINYAVASIEDKKSMLMEYSDFLNSLDSAATTKITVNNRRLNRIDFERNVLIPRAGDNLDPYREDQNRILLDAATGSSAIVQEKYVTISVVRNSVEDARTYFARAGAGLMTHFGRLGSRFTELNARERLQIIFGFFRMGEESYFDFDMRDCVHKGFDFRDLISPDSYEHERDHFRIGERFGRVLFLKDFASYISDEMVKNLTENDRDLMFSIDIIPMPIDEAVKFMEQRILGVETNIANWQRKQNMNNNFSAVVPYDMELMRQESKEVMSDLTTNDQKIFHTLMTIVITAETLKKLNDETEALKTIAREKACELSCLHFQQWEGLMTVLPYGVRKIDVFRTLTTQSLAAFVPFTAQEIFEKHGIYYGKNKISGNMIIVDRRNLLNGNSFILGVSGSGKSMTAKQEIITLMLSTDADIIIIDPEMEYQNLVKELGGEVIRISATSPNHINAMDMSRDYSLHTNVESVESARFVRIKYARTFYLETSTGEVAILCKSYNATSKRVSDRFKWRPLFASSREVLEKCGFNSDGFIANNMASSAVNDLKYRISSRRNKTDVEVADMLSQLYGFDWRETELIRENTTVLNVTSKSFKGYDKFILKVLESLADDKVDFIVLEEMFGEYILLETEDEELMKIANEYKEKSKEVGRTYIMNLMENAFEKEKGNVITILRRILNNIEVDKEQ